MANKKKNASKNKSQKSTHHQENDSNSKKRQMTPEKKSVQNGAKKLDQHLARSKQSTKQEPKGQPSTGAKQSTKHEPKGSRFCQLFLLIILASMVAVGGVIYANEEYQVLIERTLEQYEVRDKLDMVYDQLKSFKSQIEESFLQLKSQMAEPESEKSLRPKRDSKIPETEAFEEMKEEEIVDEVEGEIEKKFEQTPEQPQTIDEVSQEDIREEPEDVPTEQGEIIEPEHVQETFEQEHVDTFEQEPVESFEHDDMEPMQVDNTEQEHELGVDEVFEPVEPELALVPEQEATKSEPEQAKVSEPVKPEGERSKPASKKSEPKVAEVPEHVESMERKTESKELRENMQENEPEDVIFTEPEPEQATEVKQDEVTEPEQPQISEAEQNTRPVQPELTQQEPVQFSEPEIMQIPESETNIDIEPEQPEITQPEVTQPPEPELTPAIEPEEVQATEGKQTAEPVQPKASKVDQDKFKKPDPVKATEQEKVPEPTEPEITKPELEQTSRPVQPEMTESKPMHTLESGPEKATEHEQSYEHEELGEKEKVESLEQKLVEQHETVAEQDIDKLEMKISSMLDNEEDGDEEDNNYRFDQDKMDIQDESRSMHDEQYEVPNVEMADETLKETFVQEPVMDEVAHDQQPIREDVPAPIREEAQEPIAEELAHGQQPIREVDVPEPVEIVSEKVRDDVVQKPIREEDVLEPVVEVDIPEPVKVEIVSEPNKDEIVEKPIKEEVVSKPVKDKVVSEPKKDEVVSEPKKDKIVSEPKKDKVVSEPKKDKIVSEPKKDKVVSEPKKDKIVSEPKKEEVVSEPKKEEVVSEPKKEEVVSEPKKDKVASEPKKEEIVQSTSGETDTADTQMSKKEAEKERKEKEKAEYPNLLITNSRDYRNRKRLDSADQLSEEGDLEGALEKYDKVMEKYPNSPRANYGKGIVLDKMAEKRQSNAYLEQAIRSLDNLLNIPDVPDRLLLLGGRRLAERQQFRGWGDKAAKTWRHLVERFPEDYNIRNQLGLSYILIGNMVAAKNAFNEVLSIHPTDGFAMVHLGFILKSADLNFKEAIPLLQEGIATGEPGTEDGRFYFHLGEALQRTDNTEQAYKVYHQGAAKGLFLSAYQRSLYNVWTLTSRPWWTTEETGYRKHIKLLEDNWRVIRDEALNLLDANTGSFLPEEENLREAGDWRQLTLYNRGRKDKENCNKAPKTCEIIEQIPDAKECRRGQVKFSVMQPGVHVWPHCGPTNCRLRAHLGLVVPPGPVIRVVNETREWQEGKVFVFDDSFEHEVWHKGDKLRMVLIVDFWHPQLDKETKLGLSPI